MSSLVEELEGPGGRNWTQMTDVGDFQMAAGCWTDLSSRTGREVEPSRSVCRGMPGQPAWLPCLAWELVVNRIKSHAYLRRADPKPPSGWGLHPCLQPTGKSLPLSGFGERIHLSRHWPHSALPYPLRWSHVPLGRCTSHCIEPAWSLSSFACPSRT